MTKPMWCVVCEVSGICGALPTKKEAEEYNKEIKYCPAKHRIEKCEVKLKVKTIKEK